MNCGICLNIIIKINMAINVDTVYKTVLLILNKEQRGYVTPEEFNKISTQVQLEIFESYFEDLNQQLRVAPNESEYADRQKSIDDKLAIFKTTGNCTYSSGKFVLPANLYRLGTVIYNDDTELQRVQKNDLLYINKSALTKPTTTYPIYTYERDGGISTTAGVPNIYVYPTNVSTTSISVSYIRKPADTKWGYTVGSFGEYIYNNNQYSPGVPSGSTDFELDNTEQTMVISKVLLYMGIVIQNPEIVQVAAQQIQSETINSKS
jgi:hypothetical protein